MIAEVTDRIPPRTGDYLVGGFRISLGPESNTPGPRTHIVSMISAFERNGVRIEQILASDFPFMARFRRVRQSDYRRASPPKIYIADVVRIAAGFWSGACTCFVTLRGSRPDFIYERVAVLQSLTSFHRWKRRAVRIVEANGILSRETAHDRKVLKFERLAAAVERATLRHADFIVAVSEALKVELVKFARVTPSKIVVVPNGVAIELSLLPRGDQSDDALIVGFVGSIVAWQHLDEFLEATMSEGAEITKSGGPVIRVEIIGDGAVLESLRELSQERGWGTAVTFLGRLPHEDAIDRMRSWHVGFAGHTKSSSEQMYHSPLKLYEYAALGLSIVCTESADASALLDTGCGIFTFTSQSELPKALRSAVTDAISASEKILAERRSKVARDHSWDARALQVIREVEARSR